MIPNLPPSLSTAWTIGSSNGANNLKALSSQLAKKLNLTEALKDIRLILETCSLRLVATLMYGIVICYNLQVRHSQGT